MSVLVRRLLGAACVLAFAAALTFGPVSDAQAQGRRGTRVWDRYDRHDRGRHLGWERGRRVGLRRRALRRERRLERRIERRERRERRIERREWRRSRRNS